MIAPMNSIRHWLLLLLAFSTIPAPTHAGDFAVGVKGGTLGLGVEAEVGLGQYLALRGAYSAFEHDIDDFEAGDITYQGTADLSSLAALIDWHPTGGPFRFTVGALFNDNRLLGEAQVRDLLEDELGPLPPILDGVDLGTLNGVAEGDSVSPYVALGASRALRDGPRSGGLYFSFELGAVFQGSPQATLTVDTDFPINAIPGGQALLDRLLAEQEAELEQEAEDYEVYPVLSLGVGYAF
jgi:hypothetical protein